MKTILVAIVDIYRAALRPWLPAACRFYPSCGDYAREALVFHGVWRGLALAARRVACCHPFHPGGHDPVPARTR
jgi:putative membrane protein insertion efficiency factor